MQLKLRFSYDSYIIDIPDGFVDDVKQLHFDFLDWMYARQKCMNAGSGKHIVYAYGPEDFLRYLNEVVLKDANEAAQIATMPQKGKLPTIYC